MDRYIKGVVSGGVSTPIGARPPKSGVTTSYADYDAGFYQRGREVSFYKTSQNNMFGHNWAHTGVTGGYYDQDTSQYKDADGTVSDLATAFPDNIMIDWKTCDDVGVLMWRITNNGANINWLDSVNGCQALTIGAFVTWALPETVEIDTLRNWGLTSQLNWLPLAQTPALWTANSNIANTLTAYHRNGSIYTAATKTSSTNLRYIPCRWTLLTEL